MNVVNITQCESYDYEKVEKAIFQSLDGIHEIKEQLGIGKKVLVKTNLLMKKTPEEAVTTHPAVIEAIVRYLQNKGCQVIIGDSPGGPFTEKGLRSIYQASGIIGVAERTGCQLNYDTSTVEVTNDKAKKLKKMQIINVVSQVDFVVSAAKMKTHGMMTYTGAVKNLFGVIPGLTKLDYHFRMNNTDNFADHLIDICEYVKPLFSVMDAIEGMEGNGPSAGEKRHVGLILTAANPYALDTAAASIMGMKPLNVPTIKIANERNLFSGLIEDLDIRGVQLSDIKVPPFKLPDSINVNFVGGRTPKFVENYVINNLRPSPVFNFETCLSCGDCKRVCPAKAIELTAGKTNNKIGGKPKVDLDKCIRCFCCHELCPQKAVDIKRHWLHKIIFK
jgi:uncharacterized protein (DUF362 family)/NAD-dependent dihydropyrimidine dehydrogenase PreA subunit